MVGSLCHRVGPGRLPYTTRRDIGGGVAMAATALLATVLWFALLSAVRLVAPESAGLALIQGLGLLSPLAVIGALAAGTALWRSWIPEEPDPVRGAIGGGLTVLCSLVPVAVTAGLWIAATNVAAVTLAELVGAVTDFVMVGLLAYMTGAITAGWLAFPLGLFGGWYHERARRDRDDPVRGPATA
mgnify:CR=1 FL=1